MQINIRDVWSVETRTSHLKRAKAIIEKNAKGKVNGLLLALLPRIRQIVLGRPIRLRRVIQDIELFRRNVNSSVFEQFLEDCKDVFAYDEFSSKSSNDWNAYSLCQASKYDLCPYCQQAMAFTIHRDSDGKAFRPTLDHFYPKSQYPYLSLSLYNLIPCCHTCNSSLKGQTDFFMREHLHPFEDEEIVRYGCDIGSYLDGNLAAITIMPPPESHARRTASENSIDTFLLAERLTLNSHGLARFAKNLHFYRGGHLSHLNMVLHDVLPSGFSEAELLQFSNSNYKNEWLGRIKSDLYLAFGYT